MKNLIFRLITVFVCLSCLNSTFAYVDKDSTDLKTHELNINDNSKFDDKFKIIWKKISKLSSSNNDALLLDKKEYGWSLLNSYDSFFEDAIDILTENESGKYVKLIYKHYKQIRKNNEEIEELKSQHFTAPESSWNPLTKTQKSIDESIEKLTKSNQNIKNEIQTLKGSLIQNLKTHGFDIDHKQLDFMISSVSGPTLTKMLLVTDSLKQILNAIEKQMINEHDSNIVKSYASIYLVTILALRHSQDIAINDLKENANKLDLLIDQASKNINDAKNISNYKTDKILQSNIKLNLRTIEVAKKYKNILQKYSELILKERPNIDRNIQVARNMYNTVNNASSLVSIVHKSNNDYKALFNFSMPLINEIYANSLNDEFDLISEKLNKL